MGVLNVTPDSFSDGGCFLDPAVAAAHALEMEAQGAQIIDIGAESTRPGAQPVPVEEELRRILPVLERLRGKLRAAISIDTSKSIVARAALEAGAHIINDITALAGDPAMAPLIAQSGAGVVLMHMQGNSQTMQVAPHYVNILEEVRDFFRQRADFALTCGIDLAQIAFDPGPGFGKTVEHNLALLQHLRELLPALHAERPLLWAVSRKAFIAKILGEMNLEQRDANTATLTALGWERGARIFRIHNVRASADALALTRAFLNA